MAVLGKVRYCGTLSLLLGFIIQYFQLIAQCMVVYVSKQFDPLTHIIDIHPSFESCAFQLVVDLRHRRHAVSLITDEDVFRI